MAFRYEWKISKGGGRHYVRTFVPDEPAAAPVEPAQPKLTASGKRIGRPPKAKVSEGLPGPMVGIEAPADGSMVEITEPAEVLEDTAADDGDG